MAVTVAAPPTLDRAIRRAHTRRAILHMT